MTGARDERISPPPVLMISHNPSRRALLCRAAPDAQVHSSLAEALLAAMRLAPRAVVLDIGPLPDRTEDFIATLHEERPETAIYLVTEAAGEPSARSLADVGVSDYFLLPGDLDRLAAALSSGRPPPRPSEDAVPIEPPPDRPAIRRPPQPPEPRPNGVQQQQGPAPASENSQPSAGEEREEPVGPPPEVPDRLTGLALRDPETALLTVKPFEKCVKQMIDWACDRDAEVAVVLMEAPAAASPETLAQLGRAVHAILTPRCQGGRLEAGRFGVAWPRLLDKERGETDADYHQAAELLAALGRRVEPPLAVRTGVAVFPVDGASADAILKTAEERLQVHGSPAVAS